MFDPIRPTDTVCAPAASVLTGEALDQALLLRTARRRDEAAFEELYRRHAGRIRRIALQVTRDAETADEIVQHTFFALWERAERLAAKSLRVRPWLNTVARNGAIDHLRAAGEATLSLDEAIAPPAADGDPAAQAIAAADAAALRAAIAALPAEQRTVIELVSLGGSTCAEAATTIGAPVGTVKSRLRLAIAHLRTALEA